MYGDGVWTVTGKGPQGVLGVGNVCSESRRCFPECVQFVKITELDALSSLGAMTFGWIPGRIPSLIFMMIYSGTCHFSDPQAHTPGNLPLRSFHGNRPGQGC